MTSAKLKNKMSICWFKARDLRTNRYSYSSSSEDFVKGIVSNVLLVNIKEVLLVVKVCV